MDASQFKQIFLPCHSRMYATAWRLTGNQQEAEDLVQDTLMKLWAKRKDLLIPDNPEAFAVITLRNLYYDQHRKKHLKKNNEEPKDYQLHTDKDASDMLENKQEASMVRKIIDKLPRQQQLIITMHDIEHLNYKEIEEQTGMSMVNIRVSLSRARKAVRDKLKSIID